MKESTKIKQKQRDGLAKILSGKALNASFAVMTFALLGLASPLIDLPCHLGAAKAVAQESTEKKQKARRVPSLSESVYKKLGKGQELIDAKDLDGALLEIQEALERSRRYNENEIANLHNMLGYIYYLKEDYNGALREYKIVVSQGE